MTTLAEVAVRFKGDVGQLVQDAQAEGSKAGDAAGGTFSSSFGTKLQGALGTALGASLAVASKGMLDLDSATKQYGADTGATADQQAKAAQIANQFFASSTEGYDAILGVMGKLQTEQGLTQDQAKALTQSYLDYAKVTKQDPTTATTAFTEVIHAWGLQASDATDIQDKLVKSQQEYGTSATASQQALAQLAPQMKALGLSVDDTIGFINQFQKAGLSADQSTAALSHAIAGLKPGQNLNDLVTGIENIKDPTERAQAAMDLFGKRGGVALANLTGSYKDFEVTTEQAAGTVDTAAKDIDSSIENQVVIGLHHLQSVLVDVLGPAGPLLTGVGGIASMSKGLRDLGIPIPGVEEAMKALGLATKETGDAEAVAAGEEDALAGSEVAQGAAAEGAAASTSLLGKALSLLPWVIVLAGAAQLIDRLSHLDDTVNMLTGSGASKLLSTMKQMNDQFGVDENSAGAMGDAYRNLKAQYDALVPSADAVVVSTRDIDGHMGDLDSSLAAVEGSAVDLAAATRDTDGQLGSLDQETTTLHEHMAMLGIGSQVTSGYFKQFTTAAGETGQALDSIGIRAQGAAQGLDSSLSPALVNVTHAAEQGLAGLHTAAANAGADAMSALAQKINDERSKPVDAMQALADALKHPLSETAETARLIGELTSKTLAEGLKSGDPAIRAQAEATKATILDELSRIKPGAGTVSKEAMAELTKGMHSSDPDIKAAATAIYDKVVGKDSPLPKMPADAKKTGAATTTDLGGGLSSGITTHVTPAVNTGVAKVKELAIPGTEAYGWGSTIGSRFGAGLSNTLSSAGEIVGQALGSLRGYMEPHSPPAKGPLHEIDVWAKSLGLLWVDDFVKALEDEANAKVPLSLDAVKAAFTKEISGYAGVGGQIPAAGPDAQRAVLQGYIDDLTTQLAKTTDPAERNRIEDQIATYTARMQALVGQVATSDQKAIDALRGYVNNLDAAMLTETDPAKRAALLAEATEYRIRIDDLLAKIANPAPAGPTTADQQAATAQAKLDSLELAKNDLERQKTALSQTDAMKTQNALAITALDSQITALQNQEDAINGAKTQVSLASDLVDQLKIEGASAADITAAINASIAAQKTLNGLVGGGAAGGTGTSGTGGANTWPNGAISKAVLADGTIVWTFPDGHKTTEAPAAGSANPGIGQSGYDAGNSNFDPSKAGQAGWDANGNRLVGGLGSGGLWGAGAGGGVTWLPLSTSDYPTAGQNIQLGPGAQAALVPNTAGGPAGGINVHDIIVNNPTPEPASKSAKKSLQDLALFGVTS